MNYVKQIADTAEADRRARNREKQKAWIAANPERHAVNIARAKANQQTPEYLQRRRRETKESGKNAQKWQRVVAMELLDPSRRTSRLGKLAAYQARAEIKAIRKLKNLKISQLSPEKQNAYRAYQRNYCAKRRKEDPLFKFRESVRNRVKAAFRSKGYQKSKLTHSIIGCEWTYLMKYIEARFKPGMTWENYGSVWHVDHNKPISSGESKQAIRTLCHHTNLQPLFAIENLVKGDRIPVQQELKIA